MPQPPTRSLPHLRPGVILATLLTVSALIAPAGAAAAGSGGAFPASVSRADAVAGVAEALRSVALAMRSAGLFVSGIIESPIRGAKGNREFFIYARKQGGES